MKPIWEKRRTHIIAVEADLNRVSLPDCGPDFSVPLFAGLRLVAQSVKSRSCRRCADHLWHPLNQSSSRCAWELNARIDLPPCWPLPLGDKRQRQCLGREAKDNNEAKTGGDEDCPAPRPDKQVQQVPQTTSITASFNPKSDKYSRI